ncbi:Oxidoreductase [Granulicella sibirica]|uniref:Oxidoreductase n=2 Tax=Granulicella sibirica TaxID=2479048 RepID=A0A4Q0SY51_9BACT|nr:Oxidoreductase [Granulicella sibirica]
MFVVGGGPAGLACAIAGALRGLKVRVVDVAPGGPVDKACGEGLLPDAVEALRRLGVRVAGRQFAGIRFHEEERVAQARFPVGLGLGVRRTELHGALIQRASQIGVRVEWGTAFRGLDEIEARFVIGADGGQSRVREAAGLDHPATTRRVGLRQHFTVTPWSEFVEVYWGDGVQAYVTPVAEREVGVAFLATRRLQGVAEALACFPELRERLEGAEATSKAKGGLTVTRKLGRVTSGRVALVGDASGSVDAITGEGLNLAFRQAESLVEAVLAGRLERYEEAHRRVMRTARVMSEALLWMDRSAVVRHGAMAGLSNCPWVFRGLLGVHVGGGRLAGPLTA